MSLVPALAVAAIATGMSGCGSSSAADEGSTARAQSPPAKAAAKGPPIKVMQTDYGKILVDGRGRALYLFTADTDAASNCSGECATAWPPYVVKSRPSAGRGVRQGLIGTIGRAGSRQATYAGHPLYFYEGDDEPGEVLCQAVNEFGGYWYVVRGSGKPVRSG